MFERELEELEKNHLIRNPVVVQSSCSPYITVEGRRLLHFCSNDYLGLADHPCLRDAAQRALERFGCGTGASRLVSGTGDMHRQLEERLADFKKTEAAIVFNSGYAANTGVIPAITQDGDVILSDSLNHASIIDGCRLSRAATHVYPHRDMNCLEDLLKKHAARSRRKLIVTDGVFSMDGDLAPLPDIVAIAERYDAIVMVDDAHATGVMGATGTGTAEHFGLQGRIQVQMGTLGKALGSFGAYVAGDRGLTGFLANQARSYLFSTSLPASICAASLAALDIVAKEPERRAKLWLNRSLLVEGLRMRGFEVVMTESPIVPLMINGAERALAVHARLLAAGILATAIRYPTVAAGAERIRMTVMATHAEDDINDLLAVLESLRTEGLLS